jgi:hypothetical protein
MYFKNSVRIVTLSAVNSDADKKRNATLKHNLKLGVSLTIMNGMVDETVKYSLP